MLVVLFFSPLLPLYAVTPIEVSKTIKETSKTLDLKTLTQQAELGDKQAQFELASLYMQGKQTPKNEEKGIYWLRKSAEQNHAGSQYVLGCLYLNGEAECLKDYKKAIYLLTKSAEQGILKAQYQLGIVYYNGECIPQDYQRAFYWINKASQYGDEEAQIALGMLYYEGKGVVKNDQKAINWITIPAEKGNVSAQMLCGEIYEQYGNFKLAYTWYSLATIQEEEDALENRNRVATKLSVQQLAEAQKLTRIIYQQIERNKPKTILKTVKDTHELKELFDFSPYLEGVTQRIRRNFNSPSEDNTFKSVVAFSLSRSGDVSEVRLLHSSGVPSFDEASLSAIRSSAPFRSFPPDADKPSIEVRLTFPNVEIEPTTVN
jgi:TonB family protein